MQMIAPKKGQKVRVLDIVRTEVNYLTVGKEYEVTGTPWVDRSFSIIADSGAWLYCLYPSCAHASWEIVND